jgi:iron(II)-dependent oxidoreductase
VRARTLALVAPLDDAQLARQATPILSPVVWDLGHVACFEAQWMRTAWGWDDWPVGADVEGLYDPIAHPRTVRGALPLPTPDDARATLAGVRERTLALLQRDGCAPDDPLRADALVPLLVARHEAQHAETMLQAVQLLHDDARYEPAHREPPGTAPVPRPGGMVLVPAGPFVMGTDARALAYDNERPAHEVDVAAFRLDVHPVTNAAFLAFVDDGGYARRELWTDDGWRWLASARVAHPQQWRRAPDGRWHELHFGRSAPLAPDQPVVHVSWYEADAFARWAGKRLPTEAEWEKAAAWDLETGLARRFPWGDAPWTPERANLDQRTFAPSAAGAHPAGASFYRCEQMLGDVWEWTASDFAPYPGFVAFPYPEYSAVHFGRGYKVLRGGAWATQAIVASNTFRNWDLPKRRQIFAGFRCAADA